MQSIRYSCPIVMHLEFYGAFRKLLKYKILQSVQREPNSSMRTDRHNEANSRSLQFYECA